MTSTARDPGIATAGEAFDETKPFTRGDAVAAGLPPSILRTSRFRRIFRGVYIADRVPDSPFVRIEAALVLHPPTAFASHVSAARIFRLPVPDSPDVHVTVFEPKDRRRRAGVVPHVTTTPAHVVTWKGVRVSAPFQTFVELAVILSLVDLVVVGDAFLRVFDVTAERLVEECERADGHFAAAARAAAGYVRDEVDSPMESRLRMLIVLAGLPEPDVNHKIRNEYGDVVMRFDLSYPALKLAVEYDGRQHADDPKQWNRDLERREELDDEEWRIIVVTSKGIYREPARTIERVRNALVKRGCDSVPRQLSDDWRPFFSARG